MILSCYIKRLRLQRLPAVALGFGCACFMGSAHAAVNGMTPAQFTNVGVVAPSASQFENNTANNTASVVVLPKGMEISKSADISALSNPIAAGNQITYTISAKNLGLLGLTNVTVNDSIISAANITLVSGDTNSDSILDANEVWVWQGIYSVTQADIDTNGGGDGDIDNTVTITSNELPPLTDSVEVPVTQVPSFAVAKTVDQNSIASPTTLNYSIEVTNTGNQTLSGVTPTDTLPDGSAANLVGPTNDIGQVGLLDPGEVWQYTATYIATQEHVDAGNSLLNSVSVVTTETGSSTQSATAETEINAVAQMAVSKVVDQSSITAPSTLSYTVSVENTGNVSLTGVTLTDTLPDGSNGVLLGPVTDSGGVGVLDVGETWVYNISYPVDQATIDAGATLVNKVDVVSNETTPISDDASTGILASPAFTLAKTVDTPALSAPGLLSYIIVLENTGNVSLTSVAITDQLSNGTALALTGPSGDAGTAGVLDVGESWQYTASYSATQTDIDTGVDLTNTVNVTTNETLPQTADAVTTVDSVPQMQVSKSVDLASVNAPGLLSYTIGVANTGNVNLSNVTPVDTLPDGTVATLAGPITDTGIAGILDVGETWQYTTSYTVSQAEIDAGLPRDNTVSVTTDETGPDGFTAVATTTINVTPSFSLEKTVDLAQVTAPGVLMYDITIANTGNVTLTSITVDDTLPDGTAAVLTGPTGDVGLAGALDVGEAWTYNATYTVTQAEIDAGATLSNSVTATTAEAGTLTDIAETIIDQQSGISIAKSSVETEFAAAGDVVNYELLVVNSGNLILTNVVVSDPIADQNSLRCLPPGQPASAQLSVGPYTLEPGDQLQCSAMRTVLVSDVLATQIDNQATVNGIDPQGNTVDAVSDLITVPMTILPPLATNDHFNSPVSAVPVTLAGGANDRDMNGDKDPSTVSLVDSNAQDTDNDGDQDTLTVAAQGTWIVDNTTGNVTFTPVAGFTSDPTPTNYTVSDRSGQVSNVAVLSINYPQTAPMAKDDLKVNPAVPSPNNPTTVNVLADNGSGVDTDAENDLDIKTIRFINPNATDTDADGDNDQLIVPDEGVWQIDNATGEITFTPATGFFSDPTPVVYIISDRTGGVSNEATVTIDYPQSQPLAVDDSRLDQPLSQVVVVAVLGNDSDPEDNLDPNSVLLIDPITDAQLTELPVENEGVWSVDQVTGDITFTPDADFFGSPTVVEYVVSDTTAIESNRATVTITYEPPASLSGTIWLDSDRDGQVGVDEDRKSNWTLKLKDNADNLVATTVSDTNGDYEFINLVPGIYTVEFYNDAGVFIDSIKTIDPVIAGVEFYLPLPVDPSGIVYDSIERTPVEGVALQLVNSSGIALDSSCLRDNQQGQVTFADGVYAFDLYPDVHASCTGQEIYRIEIVSAPSAYHPTFSSIIRQQGAQSCGSPEIGCAISGTFDSDPDESFCTVDAISSTSACEVQAQADAPQDGEDTRYYVEFEIASGDQNVIFNHLPIDARANDAEIVLAKNVDQKTTSAGALVRYILTAENLKQVPAFAIGIVDTPPAGFSIVADSVILTKPGSDLELGTADDVTSELTITAGDSIAFEQIDFEPEETLQISYVMKVGVGVLNGKYVNRAKASSPSGDTSNEAVASVQVVSDPAIGQATLLGKVFYDRDKDGVQDPATVSGLSLSSQYYGTIVLDNLPARTSVNDDPSAGAITVNVPRAMAGEIQIATHEGTRITLDEEGTQTQEHIGQKARGINAQDIRICTRYTRGIPTLADGSFGSEDTDIMQIIISNLGINEPGVPGARLATASGLLVTADGYGRFNIPDVDAGSNKIGRNFILKVDPSSLPDGASFTTENPYVLRLDGSALNRMNFGVFLPEPRDKFAVACEPQMAAAYKVVEVNLGSVFFDTNDVSIRDDQRGVVADIVNALREHGGGEITISANADNRSSYQHNIDLAERRAKTVRNILSRELGDLMSTVSVEVDPAAYKESDR